MTFTHQRDRGAWRYRRLWGCAGFRLLAPGTPTDTGTYRSGRKSRSDDDKMDWWPLRVGSNAPRRTPGFSVTSTALIMPVHDPEFSSSEALTAVFSM